MKHKHFDSRLRRILTLLASITLCVCLLSGCSITDLITKGTELIDKFTQNATDPSGVQASIPDATLPPDIVKPTEPTTPPATEPAFHPNPDDVRYGVVKADSVSLYSGPSQTYEQVGTLKYGNRVALWCNDKGWVYVEGNWAPQGSFYIEGNEGTNFAGSSTVTGTDVNLRQGPGRSYPALGRHNTGDQLYILEQFYDDDLWWGYTGTGWICMDYVYVNGTMGQNYGFATVTGDVVNIRSGPGTQHSIVGNVKEGQVLEVYHYITVKGVKWCCIEQGWVCMDYVHFIHYS